MQIVVLFSDSNFLSLGILENLLSKNCFINIVTKDISNWKERTANIANKNHFSIIDQKKFSGNNFNYSIIVSGFISGDPYEDINRIFENYNLQKSKNLILIPFEKYSFTKTNQLTIPDNIGIVYLGDLIGPRIDLSSDLLISQVVNSIYFKRKISLGVGEVFYPIFLSDAVKTLSKWIFSFGPYGKESLLIGDQVSGSDFWKINTEILGNIKINFDEKISTRKVPKGLESKTIPCDLKHCLSETYIWLSKNLPNETPKLFKPRLKSDKQKKKYPKFLTPLIITTLAVLLFPLLLLLISSGFFYFSYKDFLVGKDKPAENMLLLAKTFSVISQQESNALSLIPIFGRLYKESSFVSGVFVRSSDIAVSAIPVVRTSSDLAQKILGNSVYDPSIDASIIKSGLEDLYREISFIQADTDSGVSSNLLTAKFLNSKINFEKFKNLTQYGKEIAGNLPSIIGKGNSKTYLVLFQNNMELRPTGGFIGSFGLLTFDNGRVTDLTVNDVYSADGQLNGHVEPPAPIKQYLGEANWWLRDSNWDPDFPTSAKRAEWFLDKEIGKEVDGVFAIDLDPVKNILKYTGPIFLPDYNLEITSENLYEKTQEEVQNNFFPGSRKKASFLTALSRSLLSEITKLDPGQKMGILKSFYTDLSGRHVQLFVHNDTIQESITNLSWDGSVGIPSCGETCYADFVGDVEANVGVNKANYFVQRWENLSVHVDAKGIERTMDITLKNNSNPALGLAGKYKTYIRFLIPQDAAVQAATLITGDSSEAVNPDIVNAKNRQEVGMLVEVLGGQTKKIELKWSTKYSQGNIYGKYGIYVRKQAGVGNDPLSLTINDKVVYNSSLAEDYFNRFTLK